MKRVICLMLLFLFLLTSCGEVGENISQNISEISQNETSETTEENSKDEISKEEENPNLKNVAVSIGKKYTVSVNADDAYSDVYNSELTNGETSGIDMYTNLALAGFATRTQVVIIDLEQVYDTINTVRANYYLDDTAGVSSSLTFTVEYSTDNKKWTNMGLLKTVGNETVKKENQAQIVLDKNISARYIKFTVRGNAAWIFLEELTVMALAEEKIIDYGLSVKEVYNSLGTVSSEIDGSEIDKTLLKQSVSAGKTYTSSYAPDSRYPDKKNLTDGIRGSTFEDPTWVGFQAKEDLKIKVDLGSEVKDIASIEVNCLSRPDMNIYLPSAITITAIDGKGKSTELSRLFGNPNFEKGSYNFILPFSEAIKARYIEVTFHAVKDTMIFVDEIGVFAYRTQEEIPKLYPDVKIETGETYWATSSNEYENLILNKGYQIKMNGDVSKEILENNSKITSKVMTDGRYSKDYNIHNGYFFKFCHGDRRKVIFDLENVCAVDKFVISACEVTDWAVYLPPNIDVIVSADGESWYSIGRITPVATHIEGIFRGELVLDKKIKAKFVVFAFDVNVWAGIDELEVYGVKNSKLGVYPKDNPAVMDKELPNKRIEPSQDLLGGARHLCLLYHSHNANPYKVDDLLPYVAYVDENKEIKDVMFDSFLFLHDTGSMPSGNTAYNGSVMTDWQWVIDDLFKENQQLDALDQTAKAVKDALGLDEDFTYKVTIGIYYPGAEMKNFGDVDGDGISEDFSNYQDALKAFRWYIDQIEEKFYAQEFKNIELVGYYWWNEYVDEGEPDIVTILNQLSDYVHSKDKDFFFIPWHCASGFDKWEKYGFDIACMQPNYVFNEKAPYSNLYNNAFLTEDYGLGVEMEIWEACLTNKVFYERYMEYIAWGVTTGYMTDTVNMYYQSYYVYRDAAYSKEYMARRVYDTTYHYIKGDVKANPDKIDGMTFNVKSNEIFIGDLGFDKEQFYEFQISSLPENGAVTLNDDGSFCFFPEKDFKGTVEFEYIYSEYLNWSEPIKIVINVE